MPECDAEAGGGQDLHERDREAHLRAGILWDLARVDNGTRVRFAHRDYASREGSFASVGYSWAGYLASLKDYLETGTGRPGELFRSQRARA